MRIIGSSLLLLSFAFPVFGQSPSLRDARQRWLRGNYEEAKGLYETLAKDAKTKVAATVGLSKVLQSQGEYEKALAAVEALLKDNDKDADLIARKAELLYTLGRWADAEKAAEKALAVNKDHFLGRWIRAAIYRDRGDTKKADIEFRWFVKTYTARSNADNDIKDPDELLLVGFAGAENARWNNLSDQFRFILTEVFGDAEKQDKDFWLAEYYSGLLLLEKYNRGESLNAFDKALTINPNAAEAMVGKGMAALQKYETKDAEQLAEQALKINPRLPDALMLRADVHLAAGDITGALKDLEEARKVNPRDEEILGEIAACYIFQHKKKEFDDLAKEVGEHDAKPGVFYFAVASSLENRRWYDDAEPMYKKALELRPMIPSIRNGLGLLYMRMGREKEAAELLNKAFEADPFNVRVSNTLKVLRHLDKYETMKTAHFEIRFDPKSDKPLAKFVADYLEQIYADLAGKFQYEAKPPILIEIFNSHEMFSGRTIALPDLHTIGACTGKIVAMASTHARGVRKPFNWSRVLRHELVHIFNLEQTGYQVPHWFTEGLAVINEGYPRPQTWNQILLDRVASGELLTLDTIDLGFIRPRSPLEWQLAYCQAQLYVEYLRDKYGQPAIGDMLKAYHDNLDTTAALQKVCKVDKQTFEKGYREHLDAVVKTIQGKPPAKPTPLKELKAAHEKNPDDIEVSAQLAERLYRSERIEARKLAEAVLAKKPNHPTASFVKAHLLTLGGDVEGAQKLLEAALDKNDPDPKVLRELNKLYYDAGDFAKAAETAELGRKIEPYDAHWVEQLTKIYAQNNDKPKQIAVLKDLVPLDADDFDNRKRLAKMLMEEKDYAEAEKYARQALEIDVRDVDVAEMLVKALILQKKEKEAEKVRGLLGK